MAPRPHSLASAKEKKKKQAQAIRGWQMTLVGLKLMFYIIHKRKKERKKCSPALIRPSGTFFPYVNVLSFYLIKQKNLAYACS
jgi:hypothetical protein